MDISPSLITFRSITSSDFPLLQRWLNKPFVHEWFKEYGQNQPSLQDVIRKYQPRINGKDPGGCYLELYDHLPVAFIQWYRLADFPSAQVMVSDLKNPAGLDTYIGEEDFIHKGFGPVYMRKFLQDVVFTQPDIQTCIIDPFFLLPYSRRRKWGPEVTRLAATSGGST